MIDRLIAFLVYLDTRRTGAIHKQFTGKDGYWIAYGKIGEPSNFTLKE